MTTKTSEVDRLLTRYDRGLLSRRRLLLALGALAAPAGVAAQEPPIPATSLNHVTLFVPDVESTTAFYREVFGLKVLSRQQGGVNLSAGSSPPFVGLYRAGDGEARIHHLCLGVADFDVGRIVSALAEQGLEARVRMRDDVPEIYFADPNGVQIQIQDARYCGGTGPLGDRCSGSPA